jgi:uncharacterized cupredoxin-like copper-binding protein
MRRRLLSAVPLLLPLMACAQGTRLDIPSFAGLKAKATQSVDITIGPVLLGLAKMVMKNDHDEDTAEVRRMLAGLKSVRVRSYEFNSDFAYSKSDLDGVRAQLAAPAWSQVVHSQDKDHNEDVDIYVALDDHTMKGMAIVASEPREFTIVNIVGTIDLRDVGKLEQHFGIRGPHVGRNLACEM